MAEERSFRRYPAINLPAAVKLMENVVAEAGTGASLSADDMAAILHMSPKGGATKRKIAALSTYGLFKVTSSQYRLTELGRKIRRHLEGELPALLQEAVRRVPLFEEVLRHYEPDGKLPTSLGVILERSFGVSHGNGDTVAQLLKSSAMHAGILDQSGAFSSDGPGDLEEVGGADPALDSNEPDPNEVHSPGKVPSSRSLAPVQARSAEYSITHPGLCATLLLADVSNPAVLARTVRWVEEVVMPTLKYLKSELEEITDGEAGVSPPT